LDGDAAGGGPARASWSAASAEVSTSPPLPVVMPPPITCTPARPVPMAAAAAASQPATINRARRDMLRIMPRPTVKAGTAGR
jgi:hypothetical protein